MIRTQQTTLRLAMAAVLALTVAAAPRLLAQAAPATTPPPSAPANAPATNAPDDPGPVQDNGSIVIQKKKPANPDDTPPPAPAEPPKVKNPNGETFSMRVDVPIVNLDVSVLLDKTHQFVPGLKAPNFLVLEDGVEQKVDAVHMTQTPITAVMLLEFAANSYYYIRDMQNASVSFFRTLKPDDYIAVVTFDMNVHIMTDFTNNRDVIADCIRQLVIPGFSETNIFDALYQTLDRLSRVEGRKYVILIGTGRDTFSKITLDNVLAKVKATPDVTIFTVGTGAFIREIADARGAMGPITRIDYLQADNQMKTFASMTGGLSFNPLFQGELPDIFGRINDSIRNQYTLTYRPTNNKNDGSYRHIKVYLVDNEGKPLRMVDEKNKPQKYSVIARDGYTAKRPVE